MHPQIGQNIGKKYKTLVLYLMIGKPEYFQVLILPCLQPSSK